MAVYKRFTIQQKYLNGLPQEEYRLGMEFESKAYHSMENCESGTECTQVEYRWIDVEGEYICEDTTKYAKQKRQQKCVDEEEWVDMYPYQYQKGEKMEEESEDCGAEPKWTTLTIGATPNSISQSFYDGLIVTPSKERYDFTDTVQIKLPTISGNVLSNVNYGSTMAYGQTTNSSVLNLTMSNNWYVQANYRPIQSYYLGVSILGSGSVIVTPDNTDRMYSEGTQVALVASRSIGYQFVNWQYGPTTAYGSTTTNPQLDLTMNQSWYALANFSKTETPEGLLYELYKNGIEKWYGYSRSYLPIEYRYQEYSLVSIIDYSGIINIISTSAFARCSKLKTIIFPMCDYVASKAFGNCYELRFMNLGNCSYVGDGAFFNCSSLLSVYLPMCFYVGKNAFYKCTKLETVYLPMCSYLGSCAFGFCYRLRNINLPMCSYVSVWAFRDCYSLESIDLPMCSFLGSFAFCSCSNLRTVNLPMCSAIYSYVFAECYSLESIDLPVCTYVGFSAFKSCWNLKTANLSMCEYIYDDTFLDCSSLETVNLPMCEGISDNAFKNCFNLKSISLPKLTRLDSGALWEGLTDLYLMGSSVVSTFYSETFTDIGTLKHVYVPCSMLDKYRETYSKWPAVLSYFVCGDVDKDYLHVYLSNDGNGTCSVSPSKESYIAGEEVFLSAIPNEGYEFSAWQYGSTSAYGSTIKDPWPRFLMVNHIYALANFSHNMLYYLYNDGTESWIDWKQSTLSSVDNNGSKAVKIIDYGGVITKIPSYAFGMCYSLREISFPNASYIDELAFTRCSFTSVNLPNVTYAGSYAFQYCDFSGYFNMVNLKSGKNYTFDQASFYISVSFPKIVDMWNGAFDHVHFNEGVSFPNLKILSYHALRGTNVLENNYINCDKLTYIGREAFDCAWGEASVLHFSNVSIIESGAFNYRDYLKDIYLYSTSVVSLITSKPLPNYGYTSVFMTKYSSENFGLTIHVPASLLDSYKNKYYNIDRFRYIYEFTSTPEKTVSEIVFVAI